MRRILPLFAVVLVTGACATTMAVRPTGGGAAGPSAAVVENSVWVCHQGRWQRVAEDAEAAHRRHGDAVSRDPREGTC